jgi:hypothetical protein
VQAIARFVREGQLEGCIPVLSGQGPLASHERWGEGADGKEGWESRGRGHSYSQSQPVCGFSREAGL